MGGRTQVWGWEAGGGTILGTQEQVLEHVGACYQLLEESVNK